MRPEPEWGCTRRTPHWRDVSPLAVRTHATLITVYEHVCHLRFRACRLVSRPHRLRDLPLVGRGQLDRPDPNGPTCNSPVPSRPPQPGGHQLVLHLRCDRRARRHQRDSGCLNWPTCGVVDCVSGPRRSSPPHRRGRCANSGRTNSYGDASSRPFIGRSHPESRLPRSPASADRNSGALADPLNLSVPAADSANVAAAATINRGACFTRSNLGTSPCQQTRPSP